MSYAIELTPKAKRDFKSDLKPFTIAELNQRIDQSEKDFAEGRYKTTTEMLKKFNL